MTLEDKIRELLKKYDFHMSNEIKEFFVRDVVKLVEEGKSDEKIL